MTTRFNQNFAIVNLSLDDSFYYISDLREEKECSIFESFEGIMWFMILCIPLIYFLFIFLVFCLYCKYKKVKNDYLKLKDESELKDSDNLPETQNKLEGV